jgi:hypothetical protein
MQQNFIIYIILDLIITPIPSLWFAGFFLSIPKDKEFALVEMYATARSAFAICV